MENWEDLRYVLAVGRSGGLSAAARVLGVNHSTVSRRIAAIENNIGTLLFDRLPRGLLATTAGQDLIRTAARIETEILSAGLRVAAQNEALEGELRITAPQALILEHLAADVAEFTRANPRIEVSLLMANELLNLHRREADVAIRISSAPSETLFGRVITHQQSAQYASRTYIAKHMAALESRIHDAPLDAICFILRETKVAPEILKRFPNARISIRLNDMMAILSAVKADMGLIRMPCVVGDGDPDLARVPGFPLLPYHDVWILTHPDLKNVVRIKRFMEFIARAFKSRTDAYMGT